jgi:hypothetical protein
MFFSSLFLVYYLYMSCLILFVAFPFMDLSVSFLFLSIQSGFLFFSLYCPHLFLGMNCIFLPIDWQFLAYSLSNPWSYYPSIPCISHFYTLFLFPISWTFLWYFPSIPCVFLLHSLHISLHSLCIPCVFLVYSLSIPWIFLVYSLSIPCLILVYSLSIPCLFLVYSLCIPFLSAQVTFSFFAHSNEESILNTIKQGSFFLSLKGPVLYSCLQS